MSRRLLIAGNWKMNLSPRAGEELAQALREGLEGVKLEADVLVSPPSVTLPAVADALTGSGIGVAGQNMHAAPSGAYTGEISGPLLKAAGAEWVILGHSERRQYFGETDEGVAEKAVAAFEAGLLPIICVGETLVEREAGRILEVVLGQAAAALAKLNEAQLANTVLAYEPIWAIGTGLSASPEQAQEVHAALRGMLEGAFGEELARRMRILYGGSVKPSNVRELMGQPDLDGALVGGASLEAESFLALIPPYPAS